MLAKDPAARFQTMDEVEAALAEPRVSFPEITITFAAPAPRFGLLRLVGAVAAAAATVALMAFV
jgi:hypothetical protein